VYNANPRIQVLGFLFFVALDEKEKPEERILGFA